jgi:uncharacterized protein YlxP (DUF503 family)
MRKSITENLIQKYEPISASSIQSAFNKRLEEIGIENIIVDNVEVDYEGDVIITFIDDENNEMEVLFTYDPEDGALALILDDIDSEEFVGIELDSLSPPVKNTLFGPYLDLVNLEWISQSTMMAILQSSDLLDDEESEEVSQRPSIVNDKHGFITNDFYESYAILEEDDSDISVDEGRKVSVVRGGKKVRIAVVRKFRRKILTGKQKTAFRKAARKRKMKMSRILRKRKRSLKVRKRTGIKTPKLSKFQRVAGTANFKKVP